MSSKAVKLLKLPRWLFESSTCRSFFFLTVMNKRRDLTLVKEFIQFIHTFNKLFLWVCVNVSQCKFSKVLTRLYSHFSVSTERKCFLQPLLYGTRPAIPLFDRALLAKHLGGCVCVWGGLSIQFQKPSWTTQVQRWEENVVGPKSRLRERTAPTDRALGFFINSAHRLYTRCARRRNQNPAQVPAQCLGRKNAARDTSKHLKGPWRGGASLHRSGTKVLQHIRWSAATTKIALRYSQWNNWAAPTRRWLKSFALNIAGGC